MHQGEALAAALPRCVPVRALLLSAALVSLSIAGVAAAGCGDDAVPLSAIALGDGPHAAEGVEVQVEAVVTAVFTGRERLDGFYLAETDGDDRPVGMFVYAPDLDAETADALEPGTLVRASGRSGRYRGQRQIEALDVLEICGSEPTIAPVPLELPATRGRLRRLDGLPVRLQQPLTVTGNHDLGRYGSLELAAGGRVFADRNASEGQYRLILDDGSQATGPSPVPYLDQDGTRRVGSRLPGLTGMLASTYGAYRIHPIESPSWAGGNPRALPRQREDGRLRVALFNIQNYFARLGMRGADSKAQQRLQRDKLVAAMGHVDADIIALLEVGNSRRAVTGLRDAVNAGMPEDRRYRTALAPGQLGDDGIRAVVLYRPGRAELVGEPRHHAGSVFERPLILARFAGANIAPFSVVVGHFKSKGGCPDGRRATDSVAGCWGERREAQSRALLEAVEEVHDEQRWLVLADLNAYSHEQPVNILRKAGLVDLVAQLLPSGQRYTYVYRGHSGTLDYALASRTLTEEVGQVQIWHGNADEPPFLSYGGRQPAAASRAGPFRSSDHDPVIVDLRGTQ